MFVIDKLETRAKFIKLHVILTRIKTNTLKQRSARLPCFLRSAGAA
ncbi:hypothetical protein SXCC_00714 [Gluconacetobacter sp. SXCC-1]|nr:hypothetical protein SXCC_00714 [Gluconacetobacter sp. SXCC-1]